MDLSLPLLLFLRLTVTLGILFFSQYHRRWPLEITLCVASFALALMYGITPWDWAVIAFNGCMDLALLGLLCVLLTILTLSRLMEKTGQTQRLMDTVRSLITFPRLRLAFFPALIGLLPVPGGAIFSCPMVKELSGHMNVTNEYRAHLNVWFRHIWEGVWPLYPGYVLFCALSELSPPVTTLYNTPILLAAVFAGWLFFLRDLPNEALPGTPPLVSHSNWSSTIREGLPIILGLGCAFLLNALLPKIPSGFSFAFGFLIGIIACVIRNHVSPKEILQALWTPKNNAILRMVIGIFIFKSVIINCGLISDIGTLVKGNQVILFMACIILPVLGGIFTGIMVGLVGICLPILVPLIQQAGLWDERIPWLILASMCGYVGQMISPVHVCIAVTARYFDISLGSLLRGMILPCLILFGTAIGCFFVYLNL